MTLWFQFTQGDRHSIDPGKDLSIDRVGTPIDRWLGTGTEPQGKKRGAGWIKALEKLAIYSFFGWFVYIFFSNLFIFTI